MVPFALQRTLLFFEKVLIDLVFSEFAGDAAPGQAAVARATADVAMAFLERVQDILFFDSRRDILEQVR